MVVRGKSVALVVAALVCLAPGLRAQYCANFANDSHSIPQLADQFSFRVEANFDEHGRTLIVHELYDSVNNRGSLFARRNGTASHLIYDYDDNEIFFITGFGSDQTCFVQSFSEAAPLVSNTFGVRNVSGSLQIGTASSYFLLVKSAPPTTLIGDEMVRGIPVTHWQACFERPNLTYIADYYYSTDTWNYAAMFNPGMYDSIPILITIRGNETEDDGGIENFYHVYSIFDYHTGPDSVHDHSFRVPNGLVCRGRIPGSPTPTVPNFFSATFQYSISSDTRSNAVATARVSDKMQVSSVVWNKQRYFKPLWFGNGLGVVEVLWCRAVGWVVLWRCPSAGLWGGWYWLVASRHACLLLESKGLCLLPCWLNALWTCVLISTTDLGYNSYLHVWHSPHCCLLLLLLLLSYFVFQNFLFTKYLCHVFINSPGMLNYYTPAHHPTECMVKFT